MTEEENVLRDAANTISQLRRQNEILSAKVEMIDLFACVLHTKPAMRSEGFEVDIVHRIEKLLAAKESNG